jgi:hypothetical protein
MGTAKHEEEARHARWDYIAKKKGHICKLCNEYITYSDRTLFFETGLCGTCKAMEDKFKQE